MAKPTKADLNKYRKLLLNQRAELSGDVGSLRDEALSGGQQESSTDDMADQGSDNYDRSFMLGLIENEEQVLRLIDEALDRLDGDGDFPFGACQACLELAEDGKLKKSEVWIPKERLEYLPWTRYCVRHQQEQENTRESA